MNGFGLKPWVRTTQLHGGEHMALESIVNQGASYQEGTRSIQKVGTKINVMQSMNTTQSAVSEGDNNNQSQSSNFTIVQGQSAN